MQNMHGSFHFHYENSRSWLIFQIPGVSTQVFYVQMENTHNKTNCWMETLLTSDECTNRGYNYKKWTL